ncbi:MAG: electron transfer flavoprotein subunit alpha/FixB family protein [Bacteroidetes bacterium]|nr:electron transfer flavoprotein subunit alpha/FixB family protein [Bacteroidota bacterium]
MSVLVYTEINKGQVKKSSLECVNYAAHIAKQLNLPVVALVNNTSGAPLTDIGNAGASKILQANNQAALSDNAIASELIENAAKSENAKVIIFAFDTSGKAIAPRAAAKLKAGLVAGAIDYPVINGTSFEIKKNVFSGKASAVYTILSEVKVISLLPNSFKTVLASNSAQIVDFNPSLTTPLRIKIKEIKSNDSGETAPLPEAELVVSAGRGLKGPENWGIIEELAKSLGATTACSRPVADMHWRPHHEHVGQTGLAIRPNLYIAIGISGAIQHLAGVNGSKTIVVINNDKEAPFFKSADYGIVGDAFSIVPKLIEEIKKFKANQN